MARSYETVEFSEYILANTLYGMILSFSSLGLSQWYIREYQEGKSESDISTLSVYPGMIFSNTLSNSLEDLTFTYQYLCKCIGSYNSTTFLLNNALLCILMSCVSIYADGKNVVLALGGLGFFMSIMFPLKKTPKNVIKRDLTLFRYDRAKKKEKKSSVEKELAALSLRTRMSSIQWNATPRPLLT
jgi:hypothetical protein